MIDPTPEQYWILTVRYSGAFCTTIHKGSLAEHLLQNIKQPFVFAREITMQEYEQLKDDVEIYGE